YYTKVLVACGAAGGIAGTFNTPIAGALFALELIIRELKVRSITPIVISAVFATIVSRILLSFLGAETAFIFEVPAYSLETPWEIVFYSVLGILAALTAIGFIKSLYGVEDIFDKIKIPDYLKPVIGGLCIGLMGLTILLTTGEPFIFGVGYEAISKVLHNELFFTLLFALIFLKIIATSVTLGSGGSGGIFAPSLFIGAMLGGAFGMLVHQGFPTITASHEAYAIVGMAAVFAGGSGAILTSIIMVFEMTGDYAIILPVMFASVISTLWPNSLWTRPSIPSSSAGGV
ncbi:MAG: chloride channel protein, partial [Candidatus Hadarchaeota archaeon]